MEEYYTIILAYTFHDDSHRDKFLSMLKERYKLDPLDQSTYGINSPFWGNVKNEIEKICDKIYEDVNPDSNDSVSMFFSALLDNTSKREYPKKKDKIRRIQITLKRKGI